MDEKSYIVEFGLQQQNRKKNFKAVKFLKKISQNFEIWDIEIRTTRHTILSITNYINKKCQLSVPSPYRQWRCILSKLSTTSWLMIFEVIFFEWFWMFLLHQAFIFHRFDQFIGIWTQYKKFFFPPNFVRYVVWWSSTRGLSQIWLQVKEQSRKVQESCLRFCNMLKSILYDFKPKKSSYCGNFFLSKETLFMSCTDILLSTTKMQKFTKKKNAD